MERAIDRFQERMGRRPALLAASPGRIEFIGNHCDYNGGDVLGVALDRHIEVAAERRSDDKLVFSSDGVASAYEGRITELAPASGAQSWANYPLGILSVLKSRGYDLKNGYTFTYASNLPTGAGLSSSAAIELATLQAVSVLEGIEISRSEKVLIAQEAENRFVGVPCGMLDQAVSCFGKVNHLVRIVCSATAFSTVSIPSGLSFWIFNTHHKHSLVDSMYSARHGECREALRLIREKYPEVEHLALAPVECLQALEEGTAPYKRARHVISEHGRVLACVDALAKGDLDTTGSLLFASHASSRDDFENSIPELDRFVALLEEDTSGKVVGARLTGGGFGGAVMAVTREGFDPEPIMTAYRDSVKGGEAADVLCVGSGEGTRSEVL